MPPLPVGAGAGTSHSGLGGGGQSLTSQLESHERYPALRSRSANVSGGQPELLAAAAGVTTVAAAGSAARSSTAARSRHMRWCANGLGNGGTWRDTTHKGPLATRQPPSFGVPLITYVCFKSERKQVTSSFESKGVASRNGLETTRLIQLHSFSYDHSFLWKTVVLSVRASPRRWGRWSPPTPFSSNEIRARPRRRTR